MRRLVIAVDCDDVLVPTSEALVRSYNARHGTNVTLDHMYQPATLDGWGTTDEDVAIERMNEIHRSEAHATILPYQEAIKAIQQLAKVHELHLVTGRASFLESVTQRMLDTHFPECFQSIEHTNYIVTTDSQAFRRSKGEVCQIIGAHILIDDHIQHGHSVLEANVEKVVVFGDYPWNRDAELSDRMVRCLDWSATLKEVARITHG
jgi:5'(3')-deoxyribonucleotidase